MRIDVVSSDFFQLFHGNMVNIKFQKNFSSAFLILEILSEYIAEIAGYFCFEFQCTLGRNSLKSLNSNIIYLIEEMYD